MHRETPEKNRPISIVVTGFKQAVPIKIARPMKIMATRVKRCITKIFFRIHFCPRSGDSIVTVSEAYVLGAADKGFFIGSRRQDHYRWRYQDKFRPKEALPLRVQRSRPYKRRT
jgi:hypothetical protein